MHLRLSQLQYPQLTLYKCVLSQVFADSLAHELVTQGSPYSFDTSQATAVPNAFREVLEVCHHAS